MDWFRKERERKGITAEIELALENLFAKEPTPAAMAILFGVTKKQIKKWLLKHQANAQQTKIEAEVKKASQAMEEEIIIKEEGLSDSSNDSEMLMYDASVANVEVKEEPELDIINE